MKKTYYTLFRRYKMLINPQFTKMSWHPRYRKFYEDKGYVFTNYKDEFKVNVLDLPVSSNKYVNFYCDYCLENGIYTKLNKRYQDYLKSRETINKDCCKKCKPLKIKESNMMVYGVESTNSLDSTKKKKKITNLTIYGHDNPMKSSHIKKKVEKTNLRKYGCKAPAQNDEIKEKMASTNIEKYGYISPTLNKDVRKKQLETTYEKYGVEYLMQNEGLRKKARTTLFQNGTAPISRQQRYVNEIIGGELNYPFKGYSLDIAFPEDKVYVECDFGGHWLQVKFGNKTKEEFEADERKRWYSLYRNGWKEIRIISKSDRVPSREILTGMMEYAKRHLKNHSWVIFNIDENCIECNDDNGDKIVIEYDFGKLIWIHKKQFSY